MISFDSTSPIDGTRIGTIAATPVEAIDSIVASAAAAQTEWAAIPLGARLSLIETLQAKLEAECDHVAELITAEMGKPITQARGEVEKCKGKLAGFVADIGAALADEAIIDGGVRSVLRFDPLGVCAVITPWNFPLMMALNLIVPALAAGNAVVFKPSEETPMVGAWLHGALAPALPEGLFALVQGNEAQGRALVAADVDLIAFVGSTDAGKHIMASAASGLKRVLLELGGKDPLIVFDDADLDAAARFAIENGFANAGQVCVSTERVLVQRTIEPAFISKVTELARLQRQGDSRDPKTTVGSMVNRAQYDKVIAQVEEAVAMGAIALAGGQGREDGLLIEPTVLTSVNPNSIIASRETFGPVITIAAFETDEEAVAAANALPFALGASIFSRNVDRALAAAGRLKSGMVGINRFCGAGHRSPWVGARWSGYGFHGSVYGHRHFTQTRVINIAA